jgi:hypothetical protein
VVDKEFSFFHLSVSAVHRIAIVTCAQDPVGMEFPFCQAMVGGGSLPSVTQLKHSGSISSNCGVSTLSPSHHSPTISTSVANPGSSVIPPFFVKQARSADE